MECVAWDLRWKIALGLPVDHQGWHPTSLTKFRARLLLHGKEALALENTLRLARELGMLDGTAEQIIDSTPMLGAAATQDTVRLVRHGVKKLIDAVSAVDVDAGGLVDGLEFDYSRPNEKPDARWREKAERERMLTRVAQDAERALIAVEQAEGLLDDERVKAAHQLLRELIGQDFEVDDDGVPRLYRGTRQGRIISTVDPEMRHGRKSNRSGSTATSSRCGDQQQRAADHRGDVCPAGETDGPQAKHLIDSQPPEQRPERILGDTAYGNGPVRAELAERDVEVLAPVPEGKIVEGILGKRDFAIDLDAGTVRCPAGHVVQVSVSKRVPAGELPIERRAGAVRSSNAAARASARRQIRLIEHEELLQAGRQALQDPARCRAPATHPPADRTPPRPARAPLRRPQKPLHRQRESAIAGRMRRRPGQPQPDRPPSRCPQRLVSMDARGWPSRRRFAG